MQWLKKAHKRRRRPSRASLFLCALLSLILGAIFIWFGKLIGVML